MSDCWAVSRQKSPPCPKENRKNPQESSENPLERRKTGIVFQNKLTYLFIAVLYCMVFPMKAQIVSVQPEDTTQTSQVLRGDTNLLMASGDDTVRITGTVVPVVTKEDLKNLDKVRKDMQKPRFVPDPKRALWLALVLPGAGQIYNRKYWKLPIFYGGFLGCTYAFLWNQQMYSDYSQAYLDIMDDDPNTNSYLNMLPPRYSIEGREERFKTIFKNKKDRYRRWRDLSAFAFVGVYILSVIDAYVDAELSVFDISPDLSLRISPTVIQSPTFSRERTSSYGVGCSLNF